MADDDKWQLVLQAIKQTGEQNAAALNTIAGAMGDLTQEIRTTNMATIAHGAHFPKNGGSMQMFGMFLVIITGVAGVGLALLAGEQRLNDVRADNTVNIIDATKTINNKIDVRLTTVEKYQTSHEAEVSRFNATQFSDIAWIKLELSKLWYREIRR